MTLIPHGRTNDGPPSSVRPHALTSGLLLAAGAGRRMGVPKALVHEPDGTSWLRRSVQALVDGGCEDVSVVLGAAADEAPSRRTPFVSYDSA